MTNKVIVLCICIDESIRIEWYHWVILDVDLQHTKTLMRERIGMITYLNMTVESIVVDRRIFGSSNFDHAYNADIYDTQYNTPDKSEARIEKEWEYQEYKG